MPSCWGCPPNNLLDQQVELGCFSVGPWGTGCQWKRWDYMASRGSFRTQHL